MTYIELILILLQVRVNIGQLFARIFEQSVHLFHALSDGDQIVDIFLWGIRIGQYEHATRMRLSYGLEHDKFFAELFCDHVDVAVVGHSFAQHVVDQLLLLFGHQLFVVRHTLRAGRAGIALFDQQPQL